MSEFPIHTIETAPEGSRPILETLSRQVGFIPNLAATMADAPALLDAFTSTRSAVGRGTLTGPERETIALAVSFENSCSYCMAAHSAFATMQGAPEGAVEALRRGDLPADDPRLQALAAFARRVVETRGFVPADAVDALRRAGFNRAQLLEVVAVIGMTSLANWTHNLTGAPLDDAFERHSWVRSAA